LPDEDALELLPRDWLRELRLPTLREALLTLHAPPCEADVTALQTGLHPAQRRLALEELLAHQLSLRRQRLALQPRARARWPAMNAMAHALREALPFALTGAQARVFAQLREDLAQPRPMLRLVQGDVGSGKTVVAALAALLAVERGAGALMAPTELLAEQHWPTCAAGWSRWASRGRWLAGKVTGKARAKALEEVASGAAQVVVGTHALMQEGVVSTTSPWPSSTSSTASACTSAWRCATRARATAHACRTSW
jgi:ATP-dependent DNA helicase RecG